MRIFSVFVIAILLFLTSAFAAFAPDVQILSKSEIEKLSDEKLTETYIEVVVEIQTMEAFHATPGFTPKDYQDFKTWLRYRIGLIAELNKRELKVPQVE